MNPNLDFAEQVQIVSGFLPVDMTSGANTGDWVSLENYEKLTILLFTGAGTAGDDPTITLQQGKTNSGGTPIDLAVIDKVYVKQDTNLLAVGTFSVVTQSAATTYTELTSGEDAKIWIFDIYAEDLDDDYKYVQASVADIGSQSQIGCLLYFLWPPRYGEQTLVSAIA